MTVTNTKVDDPAVWIFNARQHNWPYCARGPTAETAAEHGEENVGHPWHGVGKGGGGGLPVDLNEGDVILARRTERTRGGKNGSQPSGVFGIWRHHGYQRNPRQESLPWPEKYRWVIYCRAVEREFQEICSEDFDQLPMVGQSLQNAIQRLSRSDAKAYIEHVLQHPALDPETRDFLERISRSLSR